MLNQEIRDERTNTELNIIPVEFRDGENVIFKTQVTAPNWELFAYTLNTSMEATLTPLYGDEVLSMYEISHLIFDMNGEKFASTLGIIDFIEHTPIGDNLHVINVFRPFAIVKSQGNTARSVRTIGGNTTTEIHEGNVDASHSHCKDGFIDEATYNRLCDLNII
jgi:hypothetical protein